MKALRTLKALQTLKALCRLSLLVSFLAGAARLESSDVTGIYGLIDEVVFEPNADAPERIRITGAFCFAKNRRDYTSPARGYLYYTLPDGLEEDQAKLCRNEWSDLEKLAGQVECVAFGQRHSRLGKLRELGEKPEKPDVYPISAAGLRKIRTNTSYFPIRTLMTLPKPLSPVAGRTVEPGRVKLSAQNMLHTGRPKARYVFEIEGPDGEKETSPAIERGKKSTAWTPSLEVEPGKTYRWTVRAVEGEWKGPRAKAGFRCATKGDGKKDGEAADEDADAAARDAV